MPRFTSLALALAATAAMAVPTVASANSQLKVLHKPGKPLAIAQGVKLQRKARQTGHYPTPPSLAVSIKRLAPAPKSFGGTPTQGAPVEVNAAKPQHRLGKLFGFQGVYDTKHIPLVQWVNYVYSVVVPTLGGHFVQPAIYEMTPPNGVTPNGCGSTLNNALFCWNLNTMAYDTNWMRGIFDNLGDAAFASVVAHEYGHGTMAWLGLAGKGYFNYTLYSEGFADCNSGAWMFWMYYNHYTDSVGQGDTAELVNVWRALADQTTDLNNHGNANWRVAAVTYGWNNGFRGCANWGRELASR